jgi:hypothetical protein
MTLTKNLDDYNLKETKDKISDYFGDLEKLKWEQARLNVQRGLVAKHDVAKENEKQPYVAIRADEFNMSAKEEKRKELAEHLAGYHWAKSILSEQEQQYITEFFVNGKYEDDVVSLLGYSGSDSRGYRNLKRKAIYKFAYVLDLVV